MFRRVIGVALVSVLLLALAEPASARGRGSSFFHHQHGFNRFGCCPGPAVGGGVFLGAAEGDPYDAYPYPVYAEPAFQPAPAYQAPSVAPPVFCYVGGCYHLQGNGVSAPYQWVWVPAVPASPPGLPPAAPRI